MSSPTPTTSSTTPSTTPGRWAAILRGAARQTLIELRVQLFSPILASWLFLPAMGLIVLFFLRDLQVPGSDVSVAQLGIPGILVMSLLSSGLLGIAGQLLTERDDGTLLRAKTVPGGMNSRLIGDVAVNIGTALGPMLILLALAWVLVRGVLPTDLGSWWTLLWVSLLGLLAALPFGAICGAMLRSPMLLWTVALAAYGLLAMSGVFYPVQAMPSWVQAVAQLLPVYWIGLGLRHAMLPPEAVALEIGESWRVLETVAMLGGWAVLGLAVAPIALRRMARRQSGSLVAAARERVLSQGY